MRKTVSAVLVALVLVLAGSASPAAAGPGNRPQPGAAGIGDSYFPGDGNGGYDVAHYNLDLRYFPDTDRLRGKATIRARATQALSAFNLDLNGLQVNSVRVDGRGASWRHQADELTISPRRSLPKGSWFTVEIAYAGVPKVLNEPALGQAGVFPTADGALIIGQPHVADTWFPVNDHPSDKASYRFEVTVPRGLEVVANGYLADVDQHRATTTWTWVATDPMASYLATATIGQFQLTSRRVDGIRYWDAIDPVLFEQPEPRTGDQYAISGGDDSAYKRLSRTFSIPAGGGQLSFWVSRDTESDWDFFAVEARPAGTDSWTTLPDTNGHTTQSTGASCPFWLTIHPFLGHYQSDDGADSCLATGSTGTWHAATGASDGYEQWRIDLSAYAGQSVEIALAVISDDTVSASGVFVDDVVGPNGQGSTSFEADAAPLDGWTVSGPPAGSPANASDWRVATEAAGPSTGDNAAAALSREPEIIRFLSGYLGPYPFKQAGGIVDDDPDIGFALENQTRPIYAQGLVLLPRRQHLRRGSRARPPMDRGQPRPQPVARHLAQRGIRQLYGVAVVEDQGNATAQQIFDFYAQIPADDEFWTLPIGDPGPDHIFDGAVYDRGAMTLHALRTQIGDPSFFRLLKRWTATQSGGNVDTAEFQALAERISHQNLDTFFQTWLYTPEKPTGLDPAQGRARASASTPAWARQLSHAPRR